MENNLYIDINENHWAIIYRPEYNVSFFGLEKCHPFDARKWGRVVKYLLEDDLIRSDNIIVPNEAKKENLLLVHTKKYLRSLRCSLKVASIAEVPPLCFVPNFLVQKCFLKRMRYQVGGSILAGKVALQRGYAINIGGGFHHCSSSKGGGFCVYADITLLIQNVFKYFPKEVENIMIIDLDAHQGNGYERDFVNNNHVYILDIYNRGIYPRDSLAKVAINKKVELGFLIEDLEYLKIVTKSLDNALDNFNPQLVVYNAGTDILQGDPLGCLAVSAEGIIKRDEIVFKKVRTKNIPIVMLTSGGYLKQTAKIIADSIINLAKQGLIQGPPQRY